MLTRTTIASASRHRRGDEKLIEVAGAPFDQEWVEWLPPKGLVMPALPLGWELVPGWDVALSSGRRYDAWRAGHGGDHVASVAEAWRQLIRSNRENPVQRRFRSGKRPKA